MKKVFLGLTTIIIIITSYVIYSEYSYSPLNENEFRELFKGNDRSFSKLCNKDLLGLSSKGELFDISHYKVNNVVIDKTIPTITEWEKNEIKGDAVVGKWQNCPLDSQTVNLFRFTLTVNNFDDLNCSSSFNRELRNPKNYFSFVYFSELEQYFLLYCADSQELYYIRRRGF